MEGSLHLQTICNIDPYCPCIEPIVTMPFKPSRAAQMQLSLTGRFVQNRPVRCGWEVRAGTCAWRYKGQQSVRCK